MNAHDTLGAMVKSLEVKETPYERNRFSHAEALKSSLQNELHTFRDFTRQSLLWRPGRQHAENLIQRGEAELVAFETLMNSEDTAKQIRQDFDKPRKKDNWTSASRQLDQHWHTALGIMEEMRWEKNRLMALLPKEPVRNDDVDSALPE